ncbi:MAG: hypothetical protein ABIH50_05745 [bacterium]
MKRNISLLMIIALTVAGALAHQPVIVDRGEIKIEKPEISRAFYGELKGQPQLYNIYSEKAFDLYVNLLVPKNTNAAGRYSANIYQIIDSRRVFLVEIKADSVAWKELYEPFGGDHYLKGPEWKQAVPAGRFEIEVYNADNRGKYVLAVGEKEFFGPKEIANVYTELPKLKGEFFGGNPVSFLWSPFGIAAVIAAAGIIYLISKAR